MLSITDYIINRLSKHPKTAPLSKWIDANTLALKEIPRYLIPSYFDVIVTGVHTLLINQAVSLLSP